MKTLRATPTYRGGTRPTSVSPDSERESSPVIETIKKENTPINLLPPVNDAAAAARKQALEYLKEKNERIRRNR